MNASITDKIKEWRIRLGIVSIRVEIDKFRWKSRKCTRNIADRRKEVFQNRRENGIRNIPIFIISYNRLGYLRRLIKRLEQCGLEEIHIIDNNSSYPPLLEYYKNSMYKVHFLKKNYGHMVFWECEEFEKYRNDFYVVTDPDIIPVDECPEDFMERFFALLEKYPNVRKVGFSLKLDDLPDKNPDSEKIRAWEYQFNRMKIKEDAVCVGGIDTTFAMYVPDEIQIGDSFFSALRTMSPYEARHLPWYQMPGELSEEEEYYSLHKDKLISHWDK